MGFNLFSNCFGGGSDQVAPAAQSPTEQTLVTEVEKAKDSCAAFIYTPQRIALYNRSFLQKIKFIPPSKTSKPKNDLAPAPEENTILKLFAADSNADYFFTVIKLFCNNQNFLATGQAQNYLYALIYFIFFEAQGFFENLYGNLSTITINMVNASENYLEFSTFDSGSASLHIFQLLIIETGTDVFVQFSAILKENTSTNKKNFKTTTSKKIFEKNIFSNDITSFLLNDFSSIQNPNNLWLTGSYTKKLNTCFSCGVDATSVKTQNYLYQKVHGYSFEYEPKTFASISEEVLGQRNMSHNNPEMGYHLIEPLFSNRFPNIRLKNPLSKNQPNLALLMQTLCFGQSEIDLTRSSYTSMKSDQDLLNNNFSSTTDDKGTINPQKSLVCLYDFIHSAQGFLSTQKLSLNSQRHVMRGLTIFVSAQIGTLGNLYKLLEMPMAAFHKSMFQSLQEFTEITITKKNTHFQFHLDVFNGIKELKNTPTISTNTDRTINFYLKSSADFCLSINQGKLNISVSNLSFKILNSIEECQNFKEFFGTSTTININTIPSWNKHIPALNNALKDLNGFTCQIPLATLNTTMTQKPEPSAQVKYPHIFSKTLEKLYATYTLIRPDANNWSGKTKTMEAIEKEIYPLLDAAAAYEWLTGEPNVNGQAHITSAINYWLTCKSRREPYFFNINTRNGSFMTENIMDYKSKSSDELTSATDLILRHIAEFLEHGDTLGLRVGFVDRLSHFTPQISNLSANQSPPTIEIYQNLLANCHRAGIDTSCLTVADMTQMLVLHRVLQKQVLGSFNGPLEIHCNDSVLTTVAQGANSIFSVASSPLPLLLAMNEAIKSKREFKPNKSQRPRSLSLSSNSDSNPASPASSSDSNEDT